MLHCCVFRSQKEVRFSIPLIVWKSQIVWKPIQNKNNAGRKIAVEEAKTSLTLEMILKSLYFFPKNQMVFISFILELCVSAYEKVLKSKREEKLQRKRKSSKEATERTPKRRRKESSDQSLYNEDQSVGPAESLSNEIEQPEDVENTPQEVRVGKTKQRESKKADLSIEVCETCKVGEGDPIPSEHGLHFELCYFVD